MISVLIAVTGGSIAHTLRPLPIALRLRQSGVRVAFAGRGPYLRFIVEKGFPVVPLPMLDYARVCKMMDSENFHLRGLSEYRAAVADQCRYLEDLQPDLVLQDGPDPALPVAALEAGIDHANLANATVFGLAGPHRVVPYRPWVRRVVSWSDRLTHWANYFLIFQRNVRINLPIAIYLAQRGISYRQISQAALIPDLPELFNAPAEVAGKAFIGPLLYEPEVPVPPWWGKLDAGRPLVYVAVGTSGGSTGMRTMIDALAESEYQVVLSTVDTVDPGALPDNFFAARMVSRDAVLRRAAAIVYHGGSATTYQAIRNGVPMVAIPAHFDHDMNARAVVARGLGVSIFPHELTADGLRKAIDDVVHSPQVARNLKKFQLILAKRNPPEQGANLILEYIRGRRSGRTEPVPSAWFPTAPVAREEVACDLCGGTNLQREREVEDTILAGKQVYSLVRCANCGLVYCSPRPDRASLRLLELLEGHRNGRSPEQTVRADFRKICGLASISLQSRVLVAGCGDGQFAQLLIRQVGCETLCSEEHPALVRRARGLGLWVRQGAVHELPDGDREFDMILFLDTLERSLSPKHELASARERLAPGGCLVIRTVNGDLPAAAIDVPRSLYLFTTGMLTSLLKSAGFAGIRLEEDRERRFWCTAVPEVGK